MSDAADVPLGTRVKFLVIGLIAGGALVYGLRPSTPPAAAPAVATPSAATGGGPSSQQSTPAPVAAAPASTPATVSEAGKAPVAVVDGQVITLREVENALLKQEGVQQLMTMLDEQFKRTDWERMGDNDTLVQTNTWRVSRVSVAAQLLKQKAGDAREDLIGIALVRNALAKEGVVVDDALVANEIKRMEKRHYEGLEARKQPYVDFRTFIEQTQKVPFEQYVAQEGFRMGAGIRALVERRAAAELPEERLQEWFAGHSDRYRVQAAADVSAIYLPYQTSKGADGKDVVTQQEKDRLMGVMVQLHQAIFKRQVSFERTYQTFARGFEQHADAGGRLGWVNRDGTRPAKGARRISQRAMDDAFAAQPPYPVLLSPVASEQGIDLLLVHARRAGKEPVFGDLRPQLVADIVDSELAPRTKRVLDDLRRSAVIDYRSLPALIDQRVKDAGLSTALSPASADAPVPDPAP
jgi:hypothetical protein